MEQYKFLLYWYFISRQTKCEKNLSDTSLPQNHGSYGIECLPYAFLLYLRTLVYMYMSHREVYYIEGRISIFFPKIFKGVFSCYNYIFPDDLS